MKTFKALKQINEIIKLICIEIGACSEFFERVANWLPSNSTLDHMLDLHKYITKQYCQQHLKYISSAGQCPNKATEVVIYFLLALVSLSQSCVGVETSSHLLCTRTTTTMTVDCDCDQMNAIFYKLP